MSPRWNWDFEDEQRTSRRPKLPLTPAPPPDPGSARDTRIRRRRLGAAIAVAVAVIAIALAIALSGSRPRGAASSASTHRLATVPATPTPDTLEDQDKAVSSVLAYTPFVREGGASGRDVALTFDDGPGPYTPAVLNVLEHEHAHATFFAIGRMERYFSAASVREINDGDVIGDHTENHPMLAKLSAHEQYEELFEQIARIELLGGPRPRLFRPPYGSFNATTFHELAQLHLLMVLWSVDTNDYQQPGVTAIVQSVIAGAKPGAIFLMHDGGGDRSETIAAARAAATDKPRRRLTCEMPATPLHLGRRARLARPVNHDLVL